MTEAERTTLEAFRTAASETEPIYLDYKQMWQFALEIITFAMAKAERARLSGFAGEAANWQRVGHMAYRNIFLVLVEMEKSAQDMEADLLSFVEQVEAVVKARGEVPEA